MSTDNNKLSKKIPKAIADGKINIGNHVIDCAVLQDGSQVITRTSILKFMGRSNGGGRPSKEILSLRDNLVKIPTFLTSNNLIPFVTKHLSSRSNHIIFTPLKGGRGHGYDADIIADICDIYIDAKKAGVLHKDQLPVAETLEIISRGFTRVGIKGLVNEACGIVSTEKDLLQRILSTYINKTLLKWTKRFPDHFFEKYKKMYGITKDGKIPSHVGCFINKNIYNELAPGVLEELKKLNPKDENGKRSHTHHQLLTPEKGIVELDKQLVKVCTIMSFSTSRKDFDEKYKKVKEMEGV